LAFISARHLSITNAAPMITSLALRMANVAERARYQVDRFAGVFQAK